MRWKKKSGTQSLIFPFELVDKSKKEGKKGNSNQNKLENGEEKIGLTNSDQYIVAFFPVRSDWIQMTLTFKALRKKNTHVSTQIGKVTYGI